MVTAAPVSGLIIIAALGLVLDIEGSRTHYLLAVVALAPFMFVWWWLNQTARSTPWYFVPLESSVVLALFSEVGPPVWAACVAALVVFCTLAVLSDHPTSSLALTLVVGLAVLSVTANNSLSLDSSTAFTLGCTAALALVCAALVHLTHRRWSSTTAHLADLQLSMGAAFWEAEPYSGARTWVSPGIEDLFGYPRSWWLDPSKTKKIIHPDDIDQTWIPVEQLETATEPITRQYRGIRADGRTIWIRETLVTARDDRGNLMLRGMCQDVSEEIHRNVQLDQLSQVAGAIDTAVLLVDRRQNVIRELNPAARSAFGDASGHEVAEALPWVDEAGADQDLLTRIDVDTPWRTRGVVDDRGRVWDIQVFLVDDHTCGLALDDVSDTYQARMELEQAVITDGLTGLPNRVLLIDRLAAGLTRARRQETAMAVLLLDLDQFKEVNDTLGHDTGDRMLREVARRLTDSLRASDTVARLGGDEFAVLAELGNGPGQVDSIVTAVQEALGPHVELGDLHVQTSASIGVALFPEDGTDAQTLLQRADVAMYQAKRAGGGQATRYSPSDDHNSVRRLQLLNHLSGVVDRGELSVSYQPKLDLGDGRIVGAEALVRWDHPELGRVSPYEFIELAELSGTISDITRFVLTAAASDALQWEQNLGVPLDVSVNLTVRDLRDEDLVGWVDLLLETTGFPPRRLILELTESGMMEDEERAAVVLGEFARRGIRLSIDDFGTGHSSLTRLRSLPFAELKIDRSFVAGMAAGQDSDAIIVRSIVDLAANLGLDVVAEGAEDWETVERLRRLGCHRMQGYVLAAPLPADEFLDWLIKQSTQRIRLGT